MVILYYMMARHRLLLSLEEETSMHDAEKGGLIELKTSMDTRIEPIFCLF